MTWLPVDSSVRTAASIQDRSALSMRDRAAVWALQPTASASLDEFLAVADQVNDRSLLDLCKLRMAQALKCRALLEGTDAGLLSELDDWPNSDRFTGAERAALDYTDQLMIAANSVTPAQRQALADALKTPEPSTFVYGLYINEGYTRLLAFLDIDPWPQSEQGSTASTGEKSDRKFIEWVEGEQSQTDPRLLAAYYAFNLATCSLHGVDALTDEIVRLRSAEYHDCKFCQSVRRVVDLPAGTDDLMHEVRRYETSTVLTARQKAALEILDTFVVAPALITPDLKTRILAHFTPAQLLELLLKEVFWMSNKPMISLGTDPGAVLPDSLAPFEYDAQGNFVILKQSA